MTAATMRQLDLRGAKAAGVPRGPTLECPQQALVEPIGAAVCDYDPFIIRGAPPLPGPIALGHEEVARVVSVGEAVSVVRPGDLAIVPYAASIASRARGRARGFQRDLLHGLSGLQRQRRRRSGKRMDGRAHDSHARGRGDRRRGPQFEGRDAASARRRRRDGQRRRVRQRIADFYVRASGLKYTSYRTLTALSRGQTPGPEGSLAKLVGASLAQEMSSFGVELQGPAGVLMADPHRCQATYLGSPGVRIAGGTEEIMRNILAERVLGLPTEPRFDKDIPFQNVPAGRSSR